MTPTLPGSLPGLLRVGSPVLTIPRGLKGVIVSAPSDKGATEAAFEDDNSIMSHQGMFELDLTDPTGRIRALWWVDNQEKHIAPSEKLLAIIVKIQNGQIIFTEDILKFRAWCLAHV